MKTYGQSCPMARASEIVAERWTPVIVRNLLQGCTTFGEILEGAPGLSRTLLTLRLRTLEAHGVLERRPARSGRGHTYHLTPVGLDLAPVLGALATWGQRYLVLGREHINAYLVLWEMARMIPADALPGDRVVVRFDFTDLARRNRLWLVLHRRGCDVCDKHPGYDEDLVLTTDSRSLTEWHMGLLPLRRALHEGRIEIDGPRPLVRRFAAEWQGLSPTAHVRPRRASRAGV